MDRSNNEINALLDIYPGLNEMRCVVTLQDGESGKGNLIVSDNFYKCTLHETVKSYERIYQINRSTGLLRAEISNGIVNTGVCNKSEKKF